MFIHEKAHVDPDVVIGEGTKIWQFASVTRGTILGKNCSVSPFAMLDGSVYGDGVIVSGGVKAGAGFLVGNHVFLGPNVVLCNDCWPFADKAGYDDKTLRSNTVFSVIIEDGAAIGAGAILLPGTHVGEGAVVAAGAVARGNIPAGTVYPGRPGSPSPTRVPFDWQHRRMRWADR